MLELLPESEGTYLVVRASGNVTKADQSTLFDTLQEVLETEGGGIHLVFDATDQETQEPGVKSDALWFDMRYGARVERLAVVGGSDWIDETERLRDLFKSADVRRFEPAERDTAKRWAREG